MLLDNIKADALLADKASDADERVLKRLEAQQCEPHPELLGSSFLLVLDPVDANQARVIVQTAKQQEVPVIAYDRAISDDDTMYYVSFNNEEVGELQGKYRVEQ